ncbi:Panacea domain-containing protein [Clostridium sporogenes]|uniref:Panacea domain-containing protein n=1 Tax=Clostridium sporogenes TaxID=1509 RepID=UPI000669367D|nr:Panacea domain-containing protein [Clostridium sporogenes]
MSKAIEIAKWFINNNDGFSNSFEGNMKLNKLLYFSQLISLVKNDKPLFNDDLYAFKNGVVIESVRKEYYCNYSQLKKDAKLFKESFTEEEKEILKIGSEIFGNVDADELSQLTHEHACWNDYYNKSKNDNWYMKEESKIPVEDILTNYQEDLELIKSILSAYYENKNYDSETEKFIEINNVKYFFNPNEIDLNDNIMDVLAKFPADENAYSLYMDDKQGLVIY